MQQAIYNSTVNNTISTGDKDQTVCAATGTGKRGTRLGRWIARRWDMAGVLTLMGVSAAYGMFALAHLGM